MKHPFAEHISLAILAQGAGRSRCALAIAREHLNPHGVVNGAVLFALADTGMGAALYPTLEEGESCATIEIKINFLRPARGGMLVCESALIDRGKTAASLDAKVFLSDLLVATATGNFAILPRRNEP